MRTMRKFSGYGPSIVVLLTATIVLLAGPKAVQRLAYEQTRAQVIQARHNLAQSNILEQINQAYRDIANVVEPSVVHVSAQYIERDGRSERQRTSSGSGWIFDEQGHIVTNHHVIQNARRIEVQLFDGYLRDAVLVGSDPSTDIAVIKISSGNLHPAMLAPPDDPVNQGDLVFAFGSPFDFRFSMSSGVVSGKGRSVGVIRDDTGRRDGYENFIQVDAAINPGNSGGPLTDFRGRVIGMNTAIATNGRSHSLEEGQFAGIGLAIPMDMILPVVTQLIDSGFVTKGYLGVNLADLTPQIASDLNFLGSGALVREVHRDGPADAAGMRPFDIITHVNERPIRSTAQLRSVISSMRPGENAKLRIWRRGASSSEPTQLEVSFAVGRLDTLRNIGRVPPDQDRNSIPQLGILRMATNSAALAQQAGQRFFEGVLIQQVEPGSELANQKVDAGSVIVDVMDEPVRDVDSFINALRKYNLLSPAGVLARAVGAEGQFFDIRLRVN